MSTNRQRHTATTALTAMYARPDMSGSRGFYARELRAELSAARIISRRREASMGRNHR